MAGALGQSEIVELEGMVDRSGVSFVLDALASICYEKAEHLRSNWQDDGAAKIWEAASRRLNSLSGQIRV